MRPVLACALLVSLAIGACGGGGASTTRAPAPKSATTPGSPPRAGPAPAADTRVIRTWVDTLRRGDVAGAGRLFALPSVVQYTPGDQPLRLTLRREAVRFNRLLPCGAELLRTERRGRYTVGVFRLVERRGARCDGPGAVVETGFVIRAGRIVEWRRLPDPDQSGVAPVV
jgi:hypothetical protein